jgi:hypothetical protein
MKLKLAVGAIFAIAITVFARMGDGRVLSLVPHGRDLSFDAADYVLDLLPDWHPKKTLCPKPCFGLCPEFESE